VFGLVEALIFDFFHKVTYRGQTKGKKECTVTYVRDNFMVDIKYDSLET